MTSANSLKSLTDVVRNIKRTNKTTFEVIVIGLGSMGSATTYELAKKGVDVLGLDQFEPPHTNGSHSGQSRIVRKAYFEHPDYVPLLLRSFEKWHEMEQISGNQLLHQNGFLYMGKPNHEVMTGLKNSAALHHLPLQSFTTETCKSAYPMFNVPSDYEILMEKEAGFVSPEYSILTFLHQAIQHGAQLNFNEKVEEFKSTKEHITVKTNKQIYQCKKLVISVGGYVQQLLPSFQAPQKITRQLISWWNVDIPNKFNEHNLPCWTLMHEDHPGIYYGFPMVNSAEFTSPFALKIAHHTPGDEISPEKLNDFNPQNELKKLTAIIDQYLPNTVQTLHSFSACMYTNSSDENFIIDFLPDTDQRVVIATGFSGHGFKFVPVMGEILSDLALTETTSLPIEFLRLKRFQ